eukprot:scaffold205860_cov45-Prasinocladus_malaysianus.AAC.1
MEKENDSDLAPWEYTFKGHLEKDGKVQNFAFSSDICHHQGQPGFDSAAESFSMQLGEISVHVQELELMDGHPIRRVHPVAGSYYITTEASHALVGGTRYGPINIKYQCRDHLFHPKVGLADDPLALILDVSRMDHQAMVKFVPDTPPIPEDTVMEAQSVVRDSPPPEPPVPEAQEPSFKRRRVQSHSALCDLVESPSSPKPKRCKDDIDTICLGDAVGLRVGQDQLLTLHVRCISNHHDSSSELSTTSGPPKTGIFGTSSCGPGIMGSFLYAQGMLDVSAYQNLSHDSLQKAHAERTYT